MLVALGALACEFLHRARCENQVLPLLAAGRCQNSQPGRLRYELPDPTLATNWILELSADHVTVGEPFMTYAYKFQCRGVY
jgi:hypothetical protein